MTKRYWIVGVTVSGFYKPTFDRVTKKQINEGQRFFTLHDDCLAECNKMNEISKRSGNSQELYNFVTRKE